MEIAIYHPNYLEPFMRGILYLTKQYNVDKTNRRIVTTTIQFSLGVIVVIASLIHISLVSFLKRDICK